jgi:hypothetical protein
MRYGRSRKVGVLSGLDTAYIMARLSRLTFSKSLGISANSCHDQAILLDQLLSIHLNNKFRAQAYLGSDDDILSREVILLDRFGQDLVRISYEMSVRCGI